MRHPAAARTPPANPSSKYHACRRPGAASSPSSTARNPCPGEPRRAANAPPTPAYSPGPERAAGLTSSCNVSCARAAARSATLPPPSTNAMRLSPLGRWARPNSAPAKVRRAITLVAPRLSSVAVSCCDCNARTGMRNNRLGNGDVVTDRNIGRERRDDGAVLLERQIDRAPDLDVVRPLAAHGNMKRDRGVAARLRLAPRAAHGDLERFQFDALLLQDDDDVGRRARCRGEQQQLDRGCSGRRITVHENRWPAGPAAFELQLPQPPHRHFRGLRHLSCPAAW